MPRSVPSQSGPHGEARRDWRFPVLTPAFAPVCSQLFSTGPLHRFIGIQRALPCLAVIDDGTGITVAQNDTGRL